MDRGGAERTSTLEMWSGISVKMRSSVFPTSGVGSQSNRERFK